VKVAADSSYQRPLYINLQTYQWFVQDKLQLPECEIWLHNIQ